MVKRYEQGIIGMRTDKQGAWVKHQDYEQLKAELAALKADLAAARKASFRAGMLAAAEIAENTDQEYEPHTGTPRKLNYSCAEAIREAAK